MLLTKGNLKIIIRKILKSYFIRKMGRKVKKLKKFINSKSRTVPEQNIHSKAI